MRQHQFYALYLLQFKRILMALIQRRKYSEPTLQMLLLRILIPYATLLDALIGILSFTFLHSSFQLWIVEKHMDFYFQYKIKQQEKNK